MPSDWNDHAGWDRYFRDRLKAEQEAEQARIGPEAKVATVIYSTG
jgi:hypothetical protein